jgi:hypothetical protein
MKSGTEIASDASGVFMQEFSTEYVPSNAAMVRSLPLANKRLGFSDPRAGILTLALLVVAGLAAASVGVFFPNVPDNLTFFVFLALAWLVARWVVRPLSRRWLAKRFDELLPPIPLRFAADSAGLHFEDAHSNCRWDWSLVRGALTTNDGVAILIGYATIFVPSAAFSNDVEKAAFVELVEGNAGRVSQSAAT